MKNAVRANATYGVWKITTEGDCEGRSTRQLGVHEGFLEDILFSLGNQQAYSLTVERLDTKAELPLPVVKKVSVHVWQKDELSILQNAFKSVGLQVTDSHSYGFTLHSGVTEEEIIAAKAISKVRGLNLTAAEKKALGLDKMI